MYPFTVVIISGFLTAQGQKCISVASCLNIDHRKNYSHFMINLHRNRHRMANCDTLAKDFQEWKFSPSKLLQFPFDPIKENFVRRNVKNSIFSFVDPTPMTDPKLVSYSVDALQNILNMDVEITKKKEFAEFIAGNYVLQTSNPMAHRYGGHQFGYWAMQLGDGRAILLGEYVNSNGERWELQLKGAGKTPYSRDADGRAVLRSSIREFLVSEAMYYLGVPTSRAAAIVVSEDRVMRDMLYDGNPKMEKTAVVLRLAPSWFRFGSFEILQKTQENDLLRDLLDFIIKEHFPDISIESDDKVLEFLSSVARLTSDLVILWQAFGFTHGVLNTDNMSILGITIDYGPFGFMESYDPMYVPNASDHEARYCYGRQVEIVLWNLLKLIHSLTPLLSDSEAQQAVEMLYAEGSYVVSKLMKTYSEKLGLTESNSELIEMLLPMMKDTDADFTMTFRQLSENRLSDLNKPKSCLWALYRLSKHENYPTFIEKYNEVLEKEGISDDERMQQMCKINPCYVLRNWMVQEAINKADENDDFTEVDLLLRVLMKPFTRQPEAEKHGYGNPPPNWARSLKLSCSS
ncbi:protein nucleotidyltransferase YdiU-like [Lycorma delicatula]|uniref:protein nucleotidyltransferase YdiU-like n=1 Tax=Lycorma delicatula TaxID=130591 RepID=UPI003F5189E3